MSTAPLEDVSPTSAQRGSNPVGKALAQREDEVVKVLFEEAAKSKTDEQEQASQRINKDIERLYIE